MARCKGAGWEVFSGCSTFGNRCRIFIALRLVALKTIHWIVFLTGIRIPCSFKKIKGYRKICIL